MGSKQVDQMEKVQQLAVATHVLVVLMAVSIPIIIFNGEHRCDIYSIADFILYCTS